MHCGVIKYGLERVLLQVSAANLSGNIGVQRSRLVSQAIETNEEVERGAQAGAARDEED